MYFPLSKNNHGGTVVDMRIWRIKYFYGKTQFDAPNATDDEIFGAFGASVFSIGFPPTWNFRRIRRIGRRLILPNLKDSAGTKDFLLTSTEHPLL